MPGRDVKHQGASEPSGFRQKFSRRSLGRCFLSALGGASPPASQPRAGAPPPSRTPATPPSFKPRPGTPLQKSQQQRYAPQRRPATSLASVFLWNKTMLMWVLRVPPLARHARGGGVGRAPVALALPAEAIESRGLLTRLCFGPLDGRDGARVGAESAAGAEAESSSRGTTAGSRPVPPLSAGRPRPPRFPGALPGPALGPYRSGEGRRTLVPPVGPWYSTRAARTHQDSGNSCRPDLCQGTWGRSGARTSPWSSEPVWPPPYPGFRPWSPGPSPSTAPRCGARLHALAGLKGVRVRTLQVPALTLASRLGAVHCAAIILAIAPNASGCKDKAVGS